MLRTILVLLLILTCNLSYANDDSVAELEQRINELTDKIEQLTHKNDILLKKLDSLAADVEYRFKEAATHKPTGAQENVANRVKPGDPKQAKPDFDKALSLLKAQKYEEAEQALSAFVKAHPNSEYTGNAYYWLGESFMLVKKYDKAAINYILSFNKFPKNSKADLSMLKLSKALSALGKKKEACSTLAKLKLKKDTLSPVMQKMLQKEITKAECS
jgi:tol-pal system protein YbgF